MEETLINKAFSVSDSIFLVLLVGLALGTWWIIRYVFKKNDEREARYITVIESQARAIQSIDDMRGDIKDIKHTLRIKR